MKNTVWAIRKLHLALYNVLLLSISGVLVRIGSGDPDSRFSKEPMLVSVLSLLQ